MLFFLIILFLFGAVLGSFSSVIIHRLRTGEKGIFMGRSKCPKCKHILGAKDLVPIFSYLSTLGKCRYCKSKVSIFYPVLELSLGIFFVLIGYFLVDFNLLVSGNISELLKLDFLLFIAFFTFIYTVYDILYLEIPESIMTILNITLFIGISIFTLFPDYFNLGTLSSQTFGISLVTISSILVSVIILVILYIIMLKGLDEKYDIILFLLSIGLLVGIKIFFNVELTSVAILSSMTGILAIYGFFLAQILVSKGKWMGAGDLRIAIVLGLILGYSFWLPGLAITYLVGCVISLSLVAYSKFVKGEKTFNSQVPFGPFLTIGLFMTLFFKEEINTFITSYFLL